MCNNSVKIVLFGSFSCCESSFHTQCIYEGVRGSLDLQAASSVSLPLPFQFTLDVKRRLWEMLLFICISSFTFIHRVFFFPLAFYFVLRYCQLTHNVVIVSGERRRDSSIHIHVSILPKPLSNSGCHVTLSKVPCAIQQVLACYPF